MYANFSKKEFHEWLLMYLYQELQQHQNVQEDDEIYETEPHWAEFLDMLQQKQFMPFFIMKRPVVSMRVRTFGRTVAEKFIRIDQNERTKLMF